MIKNIKIYVINLDRDLRRKRAMQKQAAKHSLEFEIVSAVDGKKLNQEWWSSQDLVDTMT